MRLLTVFAVFAVIMYLVGPLLPQESDSGATMYLYGLPVLILPAIVFVLMPVNVYYAARQRWQAAGALSEPRSYTFSDAGVQVAAETFEGFVAWSHIIAAERVGGLILLSTAQQQFYLIPVRSFDSDEAVVRFSRLVAAKVRKCRL